jgi:hypothetical protein
VFEHWSSSLKTKLGVGRREDVFDEDGLGNYGTDAARTRKSGDGRDEMDE